MKSRSLTCKRRLTRTAQWCYEIFYQAINAGLVGALQAATSQSMSL
jgi:hypothetical protein